MLELRLRKDEKADWFRYKLDPNYQFVEVEQYVERQLQQNSQIRLSTAENNVISFQPSPTFVIQLLCL